MPHLTLKHLHLDLYYQNYRTLLLQTGYLTFVSGYDAGRRGYNIGYPNEEVRYSMTEQIMEFVGGITPEQFGEFGDRFRKALAADDLGLFCKHLQDFIKLVPHNIRVEREKFYQQIFFMVCVLFGKRPATEVATEEGLWTCSLKEPPKLLLLSLKGIVHQRLLLNRLKQSVIGSDMKYSKQKKLFWQESRLMKLIKVLKLCGKQKNFNEDHYLSNQQFLIL